MLEVVCVAVHVPDVGHVFLLQVVVDALADANQAVLVAARDVEEPDLRPGGCGIGKFIRWQRVRQPDVLHAQEVEAVEEIPLLLEFPFPLLPKLAALNVCGGTFTGTGSQVDWRAPDAVPSGGTCVIELTVAVDGLSVITSAQNEAIECLSFVDLYALLGPDAVGITNWADATELADGYAATVTDLGAVHTPYPDAELTVTAPGEESGTFDSFVEIVIAEVGDALGVEDANVRVDYTASPNDNVIIEGIAANPTSLGWVGFAFVEENLDVVKPLQVDGGSGCIEPTPETIASGEFPIARDLYIYVNAAKAEENPAVAAYVDYYVNEGITTLVGTGEGQVPYVPLAADAVAEAQGVWAAREAGTREG